MEKISKNPKNLTLKKSVQSSYSFRSVPARLASQAEKTMEQVVEKESAGGEVRRKPGRPKNSEKWVKNTPKTDTFASTTSTTKPQLPDPTLLIENQDIPTTQNTCMMLPEVVHR